MGGGARVIGHIMHGARYTGCAAASSLRHAHVFLRTYVRKVRLEVFNGFSLRFRHFYACPPLLFYFPPAVASSCFPSRLRARVERRGYGTRASQMDFICRPSGRIRAAFYVRQFIGVRESGGLGVVVKAET